MTAWQSDGPEQQQQQQKGGEAQQHGQLPAAKAAAAGGGQHGTTPDEQYTSAGNQQYTSFCTSVKEQLLSHAMDVFPMVRDKPDEAPRPEGSPHVCADATFYLYIYSCRPPTIPDGSLLVQLDTQVGAV